LSGGDGWIERRDNFATVRESRDSAMDPRPNDTGVLDSNRLGHKELRRSARVRFFWPRTCFRLDRISV